MMKVRTYFKFQIKDNKGVLYVYYGVYIALFVLAVWLHFLGAGDSEALYQLHGLNSFVARICMLVLAPMPILVLSSEMIERKKHPHLKIYGFQWNLKATLLGIGISVAAPLILISISNVLFMKGIQYYVDMSPAIWMDIMMNLLEYEILIMVISGMAFLLGKYIRSVLLTLSITLFYTLIVEFFPFDLFGRDFPALDVTIITNMGDWHWSLYWLILGVGFWVVGMINYK